MNKILETIQIDIVADHLPAGLSSSSSFLREQANRIALPDRAGFIFKGSITPIEPLFSLFQLLPMSSGVNPGVSIIVPANFISGSVPVAMLSDISVDVPIAFNGTRARIRGSVTVYDELDAPEYSFAPTYPLSSGSPWPSSVTEHTFPNGISVRSTSQYGSAINLKNFNRLPPGAYILSTDLSGLDESFVAANDDDTEFLYVLNEWSPDLRQPTNTIVTPVFDVVIPQQTKVNNQVTAEESLSGIQTVLGQTTAAVMGVQSALESISNSVATLSTNPPTLHVTNRTTGDVAITQSADPLRLQFLARMTGDFDVAIIMKDLTTLQVWDLAQAVIEGGTKTPILTFAVQVSGIMSADSSDMQSFEWATSLASTGGFVLNGGIESPQSVRQEVILLGRDDSSTIEWNSGGWLAYAQAVVGANLPVASEIPLAYLSMTKSGGDLVQPAAFATITQYKSDY